MLGAREELLGYVKLLELLTLKVLLVHAIPTRCSYL